MINTLLNSNGNNGSSSVTNTRLTNLETDVASLTTDISDINTEITNINTELDTKVNTADIETELDTALVKTSVLETDYITSNVNSGIEISDDVTITGDLTATNITADKIEIDGTDIVNDYTSRIATVSNTATTACTTAETAITCATNTASALTDYQDSIAECITTGEITADCVTTGSNVYTPTLTVTSCAEIAEITSNTLNLKAENMNAFIEPTAKSSSNYYLFNLPAGFQGSAHLIGVSDEEVLFKATIDTAYSDNETALIVHSTTELDNFLQVLRNNSLEQISFISKADISRLYYKYDSYDTTEEPSYEEVSLSAIDYSNYDNVYTAKHKSQAVIFGDEEALNGGLTVLGSLTATAIEIDNNVLDNIYIKNNIYANYNCEDETYTCGTRGSILTFGTSTDGCDRLIWNNGEARQVVRKGTECEDETSDIIYEDVVTKGSDGCYYPAETDCLFDEAALANYNGTTAADTYPITNLGDCSCVHGCLKVNTTTTTCDLLAQRTATACELNVTHDANICDLTVTTNTTTCNLTVENDTLLCGMTKACKAVYVCDAVEVDLYTLSPTICTCIISPISDCLIVSSDTISVNTTEETICGDLTVCGKLNTNGDIQVTGDLFVNGTTHTINSETIDSESDTIVLRANNTASLGTGEVSGLQINNYNGTDTLSVGADCDGTLRVGTATGTNTTYTEIAYNDTTKKWYSYYEGDEEGEYEYEELETQPNGTITAYSGKAEVEPYTHYTSITFTVIDTASMQPVLTRSEEASMTDGALLKWDATNKCAYTENTSTDFTAECIYATTCICTPIGNITTVNATDITATNNATASIVCGTTCISTPIACADTIYSDCLYGSAECFNGCTYAQACNDIRDGLLTEPVAQTTCSCLALYNTTDGLNYVSELTMDTSGVMNFGDSGCNTFVSATYLCLCYINDSSFACLTRTGLTVSDSCYTATCASVCGNICATGTVCSKTLFVSCADNYSSCNRSVSISCDGIIIDREVSGNSYLACLKGTGITFIDNYTANDLSYYCKDCACVCGVLSVSNCICGNYKGTAVNSSGTAYTTCTGTVTGITVNGATYTGSGVINLGTIGSTPTNLWDASSTTQGCDNYLVLYNPTTCCMTYEPYNCFCVDPGIFYNCEIWSDYVNTCTYNINNIWGTTTTSSDITKLTTCCNIIPNIGTAVYCCVAILEDYGTITFWKPTEIANCCLYCAISAFKSGSGTLESAIGYYGSCGIRNYNSGVLGIWTSLNCTATVSLNYVSVCCPIKITFSHIGSH